jgi:hypothetical protein
MEVSSDYEKSVNFSALKTYRWTPKKEKGKGKPSAQYQFIDTQVRSAVERELTAKGFKKQPDGDPDFFIRYYVRVQTQTDNDELSQWTPRIGPVDDDLRPDRFHGQTQRVSDYEEGTLLLVVADGQFQRSIWRGKAKAQVVPSDSEKNKKQKINEAVTRILAQFPPK